MIARPHIGRRRSRWICASVVLAWLAFGAVSAAEPIAIAASAEPSRCGAAIPTLPDSSDAAATIQARIDACAAAGGGTLTLDGQYRIAHPLYLKSRVTLAFAPASALSATWTPDSDIGAGTAARNGFVGLLNIVGQEDVAIIGPGTIDGGGAPWWRAFRLDRAQGRAERKRPWLILIQRAKRVRIEGLTLLNSPMFHLVPEDSEDVVIDGITIRAPPDSPNTDGIDPSSSRRVRISNCSIDTGDDNIAIKAGHPRPEGAAPASADIVITDCRFGHGHGLSIGSETNAGVGNVRVERIRFLGTAIGLRIKSARGRGGEVSGVSYTDIAMDGVATPLLFTAYYPKIPPSDARQTVTDRTPYYHDIRILRLRADRAKVAGIIIGVPERPLAGIRLEETVIFAERGLTVRDAEVEQISTQIRLP